MLIKKILLIIFFIILLIAIPLGIYVLKQQQIRHNKIIGSKTPSVYFSPREPSTFVGKKITLAVIMDPQGKQISSITVDLSYNPVYLSVIAASFIGNGAIITQGPIYKEGNVTLTLSAGNSQPWLSKTQLASLTFLAVKPSGINPSVISLKATSADLKGLSLMNTTKINIAPLSSLPSYASESATIPVCLSLVVNKNETGTASSRTLTFYALAALTKNTLSKASFVFGDGTANIVNDIKPYSPNAASASASHTYTTVGNYTAFVSFENANGLSSSPSASCKKTVSIN